MIDPTMQATPARKNRWANTSPAAARLRAKPVSEMALGVRRDSISRLRISSCVVGPSRGRRVRRGRGGATGSLVDTWRMLVQEVRHQIDHRGIIKPRPVTGGWAALDAGLAQPRRK